MPETDTKNLLAFLKAAGQGTLSGRVQEWPQLQPACKWAAEYIEGVDDASVLGLLSRAMDAVVRARTFMNTESKQCPYCGCNRHSNWDEKKDDDALAGIENKLNGMLVKRGIKKVGSDR
jgi:hypothetical protein